MKQKYIIGGIGVLAVLGVIFLGALAYVASQIVSRGDRKIIMDAKQIWPRYVEASFMASDGVPLKGWLFEPTMPNGRLVLQVAGDGSTRVNEDYNMPQLAPELLQRGYAVMLYDARGIGESGGAHRTHATQEYRDALGAIAFAKTKGYTPDKIALLGDSMGATTLANNLDKFEDVKAIILDSPAESYEPIITFSLHRDFNVPNFLIPTAMWIVDHVYGFNVAAVRPIDRIAIDPQRQLLFLHAVHDTLIPVQNSRDLVAKAPVGSRLVEFPDGEHIQTYYKNPEEYRQTVFPWLDRQFSR